MTTPDTGRVVGLGQATVEQIGVGPRSSEAVVELETFSIQAGGAVGTTLATVCALGGQARYFGRLSDDEFGSMIVRGLKDFGVDMSSVLIEPGKISPTSFILVDERTGRRLMRFTRGSTTPLDPGELPRKLLDGARLLLKLVSTRLDRDPEIPLAPGEDLQLPVVPGYLADTHPDLVKKVKEEYPEVLAHYNSHRYVTGYKVLEAWPEDLWAGLGKDFSLLTGFLDYKAEIYADAIDELKALAEDATYVARRPEVLYYLGRSYYAAAQFTKAVDALERYVRSQTVLGRDILPAPL